MRPAHLAIVCFCVCHASARGVLAAPSAAQATAARPAAAASEYDAARRIFYALKASPSRQKFRHHWLKAIAAFSRVAQEFSGTSEGERALYTAGELWRGLHAVSRERSDRDQALATYERLTAEYPASTLADDAARWIDKLAGGETRPRGGEEPTRLFGHLAGDAAASSVVRVARWSNPRYARVVAELDGPAQARSAWAQASAETRRLFVDISPARLAPALELPAAPSDEALREVRTEQVRPDTVRLHLTLTQPTRPRIMILENPYRVVIDAFLEAAPAPRELVSAPRVVLDPGHGGKDTGAIGPGGTREKDVALGMAHAAAELLRAAGVEVTLTREDDSFVSLEQRTAHANHAEADVLVSLHVNAAKDPRARGIETYYLDTTDDRFALRLAARENATSEAQVSDAQLVVAELATKAATRDSAQLARAVQRRMLQAGRRHTPGLRNHGVKASLLYVLLGARMPSILVEAGFVSNPAEERLLAEPTYQRELAQAVADAVIAHLRGVGRLATPIAAAPNDLRSP